MVSHHSEQLDRQRMCFHKFETEEIHTWLCVLHLVPDIAIFLSTIRYISNTIYCSQIQKQLLWNVLS